MLGALGVVVAEATTGVSWCARPPPGKWRSRSAVCSELLWCGLLRRTPARILVPGHRCTCLRVTAVRLCACFVRALARPQREQPVAAVPASAERAQQGRSGAACCRAHAGRAELDGAQCLGVTLRGVNPKPYPVPRAAQGGRRQGGAGRRAVPGLQPAVLHHAAGLDRGDPGGRRGDLPQPRAGHRCAHLPRCARAGCQRGSTLLLGACVLREPASALCVSPPACCAAERLCGAPGGYFDPLGLASGDDDRAFKLKTAEMKHGRLAMIAFLGARTAAAHVHRLLATNVTHILHDLLCATAPLLPCPGKAVSCCPCLVMPCTHFGMPDKGACPTLPLCVLG